MVPTLVDREQRLREITDAARQGRQRPRRGLWIGALVVGLACVGGLAIAWLEDRDTVAVHGLARVPVASSGGGLGLIVGIAVGVVIGSLIALRRR